MLDMRVRLLCLRLLTIVAVAMFWGVLQPTPSVSQTNETAGNGRESGLASHPALKERALRRVEIAAPTEPKALKAFKVLETHCARCHQDGRLKGRLKPAKSFGNILKLGELARDPHFVEPGNPDASRLYTQIVKREMPHDVFRATGSGAEPMFDELLAVRSWIASLEVGTGDACQPNPRITQAAIVAGISAYIGKLPVERRSGMRFLTLSHLHNQCVGTRAMAVYRQGVVKLLNSLSRNVAVLKLNAIDEAETVIAFHLDDLSWTESDWTSLVQVYPYAAIAAAPEDKALRNLTKTSVPYLRGDWFGYVASRPPFYHQLLKVPASAKRFEAQLGVDVRKSIAQGDAKRAGVGTSLVSPNNRVIERHPIKTGALWMTYDFARKGGRRSLLDTPLGPGIRGGFSHDGSARIWTLPNGFVGYFLSTSRGKRLNVASTRILRDRSQQDLLVTNGVSCMSCHRRGYVIVKDDVRQFVRDDVRASPKVRAAVDQLYPSVADLDALFDADRKRFDDAMRAAELNPTLELDGAEPVTALSRVYEKDLTLAAAASEFGLDADTVLAKLGKASDSLFRMKRRLQQGGLPRRRFESLYYSAVGTVTGAKTLHKKNPVALYRSGHLVPRSARTTFEFDLSLISDKSTYYQGDIPTFTVRTNRKCYLTLINVDRTGRATVLYPNDFQRSNLIEANRDVRLPGANVPFQLRLKDKGEETIIAKCIASQANLPGLKHDFVEQRFTDLGLYSDFERRSVKLQAAARSAALSKKKTRRPPIFMQSAIKLRVE